MPNKARLAKFEIWRDKWIVKNDFSDNFPTYLTNIEPLKMSDTANKSLKC